MRDRSLSADLLKAFRESRYQVVEKPVETVNKSRRGGSSFNRGYKNVPKSSDPYSSFKEKYNHLSDEIDSFTTRDLMYFFREKAKEAGVKYVIANMKRDMGIFKKLQSNYSVREICLMIEFIFFSEQDYLDKSITQPTVLASSWCNTIYRDALLWVDDQYVPSARKTSKSDRIAKREWQREVTGERVSIGEWE